MTKELLYPIIFYSTLLSLLITFTFYTKTLDVDITSLNNDSMIWVGLLVLIYFVLTGISIGKVILTISVYLDSRKGLQSNSKAG